MHARTTALLLGLLLALPFATHGQSTGHPFAELVGKTIESNNLFLLWQEGPTDANRQVYQKVYRYRAEGVQPVLEGTPRAFDNRPATGNVQMTVATGRFNEDPYDDVVAAWEGAGQTIELLIPHFDTTDVMWKERTRLTVEGPVIPTGGYVAGRILLETGDLDGDGLDEFVLVYQGADRRIHLHVYDTDGTLAPDQKAAVVVAGVPALSLSAFTPADVAVADLDGDGQDEIVVAHIHPDGGPDGRWTLSFSTYRFDGGNTLNLLGRHLTFQDPSPVIPHTQMQFAMEAGRFMDEPHETLVFAWSFNASSNNDTFVYLMEYVPGDGTFTVHDRAERNAAGMHPLGLAAGDITGDGRAEVVLAASNFVAAFTVGDDLTFTQRFNVGYEHTAGSTYDYVAVADVDQDLRAEVIVSRVRTVSGNSRLETWVYEIFEGDPGTWGNRVAVPLVDEPLASGQAGFRRFALAAGNFDGYAFRLGEPLYSVAREGSQPVVILNAPPIHFDVFEGANYDVNGCYAGSGCGFRATYETSQGTTTELTTEVRSDWGISGGVGYSGEVTTAPMGVGASFNIETYYDEKYGDNFSKTDTEGVTVNEAVTIAAVEDDMIYATLTDYDIWEYPVYHGAETFPRRYTIAVVPVKTQGRWFPSKSWNGASYIREHEVGNILSYPAYEDLADNPSLRRSIKASYESDTWVLDANTAYAWTLNRSSFTATSADTTIETGFDAKLNVAFVRLATDYTETEMSTHKISVSDGLSIKVELGGIQRSFGETRYEVTPYAYWARNGALVVDYAVSPEISGPGGSPTWWQARYGSAPDPAFILPWRNDPEKGFGIGEEAKRHQTQDVIFDPVNPLPGDTLTLTARVRNFSLVGTAAPVTVHFFVGDPDVGGTPILGAGGEAFASTAAAIPAQRRADAVMRWVVPENLPNNPRIYAVLNRDASAPEIHANNNKGFNILGVSGAGTSVEPGGETASASARLQAAYPNPFRDRTAVGVDLAEAAHVRLTVHDLLGRRVATLADRAVPFGSHTFELQAEGLATGVYFYTLVAQPLGGPAQTVRETRKVVLVR